MNDATAAAASRAGGRLPRSRDGRAGTATRSSRPSRFSCARSIVLPLGHAFWTSLHRVRGLNTTFVGLANYGRVLSDEAFWHSLGISLVFTGTSVALHLLLGLALALMLHALNFARTPLRILFLTPWMVAPAVGATIWLWLLEPQFGVVNYLLRVTHLASAPVAWLGEPATALAAVIAVDVWRGVPFVMLLMLAGLQTIPVEQYEAAAIDGANAWQRFRYVTWPNLRYLVVVASTLDVINTIRHYDIIGVMTAGGPAGGTEVLPVLLYNTAFRANRFGEAAAIGVALLVLVLIVLDRLRAAHAARPRGDRGMNAVRPGRRLVARMRDARRAGRRAVPVLLDAQHVAQAAVRGVRIAADVRLRALVARCLRVAVRDAPGRPLFPEQHGRRSGRDDSVGVPRGARGVRPDAILSARRDAVRHVPAVHEDAARDAADHSRISS